MIIHDLIIDISIVTDIGSSRAISTSKIIKITAMKYNRDENGNRAEIWGQIHVRMGISFLGIG
jgi:hypothetical protein